VWRAVWLELLSAKNVDGVVVVGKAAR
jgi:hypothetical protein